MCLNIFNKNSRRGIKYGEYKYRKKGGRTPKTKNLSMRELAKLAEITLSMLREIERGLANPSIQTLKLLAKALEVPTFGFLMEDTNTADLVVRANERKKMNVGNLSYELLSPDLTGALAASLMTLPPNAISSDIHIVTPPPF